MVFVRNLHPESIIENNRCNMLVPNDWPTTQQMVKISFTGSDEPAMSVYVHDIDRTYLKEMCDDFVRRLQEAHYKFAQVVDWNYDLFREQIIVTFDTVGNDDYDTFGVKLLRSFFEMNKYNPLKDIPDWLKRVVRDVFVDGLSIEYKSWRISDIPEFLEWLEVEFQLDNF